MSTARNQLYINTSIKDKNNIIYKLEASSLATAIIGDEIEFAVLFDDGSQMIVVHLSFKNEDGDRIPRVEYDTYENKNECFITLYNWGNKILCGVSNSYTKYTRKLHIVDIANDESGITTHLYSQLVISGNDDNNFIQIRFNLYSTTDDK